MLRAVAEPTSRFVRVLVVDDDPAVREMLELLLSRAGYEVVTADSGEAALAQLEQRAVDVVLSDVRMPGMGGLALVDALAQRAPDLTVVVMSAFGSVELALDAMRRGAYDYIPKPFKPDEVVLALRKAEERERLRRENAALRERVAELEAGSADRLGGMVIASDAMRNVARLVRKVAAFDTSVLVLGESGVGKELVSRAIHDASPRADGPFVAVNCGAIPEALLESELFGHVRGAFTDARSDRVGLFEAADGGTLLLDEIGELPLNLQVKLLRVLQEGEIRRVGETRPRKVDVRVVAATSRDLAAMVEEGTFRQDLLYRLDVMTLRIPPLRERVEEIGPLCAHFVARLNERLGTSIEGLSEAALERLRAYPFPGNVRELENVLEHAAVMADGPVLMPEHLPERVRAIHAEPPGDLVLRFSEEDLSVKRAQRRLERTFIECALAKTGGNRTHAAKLLDLSHRALLYKMKEFGLR
ncbi:MAG: sigma-54-dependent Fis family transcriptional regulator [Deltaproteobacteria bacterium]|nr:MAG: sigma-54-dependent Fis family transcriptional regulator [Deltaproteobacteria bacterium]